MSSLVASSTAVGGAVAILGGGPAGAVCAAQLARRGVRVIVFEKDRFPRFHLGESLLPQSVPVLAEIGVLDKVEATFLRKYGARFHDDVGGRKERFAFANAWRPELDHAFEVPRDAFDKMLLDHARACGAEVREGWTVERLVREAERAVGVEVTSPEGVVEVVRAAFVVDASGRDVFSVRAAGASGGTEKIAGLEQTAIFAHFEGIPRAPGMLEGDIDIVLVRASASERPNWFWFIPFNDGRTSVGAVVSREWMRDRRARARVEGAEARADSDALFEQAVAESPTAREMLASARRLWPAAQATADFSYRVRTLSGPGWLAIGDAAGFIDPLFSSGAHLAMMGAKTAADAIVASLQAPDGAPEAIRAWEQGLRRASEMFILAVRAFYAGPLVEYLFAENKHAALRSSITSLLAGDVFQDAVWVRDARRRISAMVDGTAGDSA